MPENDLRLPGRGEPDGDGERAFGTKRAIHRHEDLPIPRHVFRDGHGGRWDEHERSGNAVDQLARRAGETPSRRSACPVTGQDGHVRVVVPSPPTDLVGGMALHDLGVDGLVRTSPRVQDVVELFTNLASSDLPLHRIEESCTRWRAFEDAQQRYGRVEGPGEGQGM